MSLPVTLKFYDDESPISLVSRLAHANGYDSLQSFLAFTYTNREAITRGDPDALSEISTLSGVATERLVKHCMATKSVGLTWGLGYAIFNKEMRPAKTLRYCPHCVINDIKTKPGRPIARPYARSWWYCRGIKSCSEHDCCLVEVSVSSLDDRDDFSRFVAHNIDVIHANASKANKSSSPNLDQYLRDRIFQRGGSGFINSLDEHIVFELSGYLGQFITIHNLTDWQNTNTSHHEWGFLLASKGKPAIVRLFSEVIDDKRPSVVNVEQFFGPMIKWLRRNEAKPSYNDVVSTFQEIAEKNMPFGPGMSFIRPVQKRYLYCVNSAYQEFKITKKRIKTLVIENGLTTCVDLLDSSTYFDASAARPILEKAQETITSKNAADILGIHEDKFRLFVKAGLLPQHEKQNKSRIYIRIQKTDLDDLQAKLISRAQLNADNDEQWVTPQDFSRDFSFPLHDILKLMLSGDVRSRIIPGADRLMSRLRINKEEMRPFTLQRYDSGEEKSITFEDALALLGTSDPTLLELIKRGYVTEKPYDLSQKRIRLINKASIIDFKRQYISLIHFCEEIGVNRAGMKKRLAELNVVPLFDYNNRVASYYLKTDLEKSGAYLI